MTVYLSLPTGQRHEISRSSVVLGSDPSCDICLTDYPGIQPRHARLRKLGDRWLIESLGDWAIRHTDQGGARMTWLRCQDAFRLTESGPVLHLVEGTPNVASSQSSCVSLNRTSLPRSRRETEGPDGIVEMRHEGSSVVSGADRTEHVDRMESSLLQVEPKPPSVPVEERFEVRPRIKRNAALTALGCLAFTVGGLWIIASGEHTEAGLLAVLFFGGLGLLAIPNYLRRPVSMVISREGIEQRSPWGAATIPWSDVEAIGLFKIHSNKIVGLRLVSYDNYLASFPATLSSHVNNVGMPLMRGMASLIGKVASREPAMQAHNLKSLAQCHNTEDAMRWTRQQYGYDLCFCWADMDRAAEDFLALLEEYRSASVPDVETDPMASCRSPRIPQPAIPPSLRTVDRRRKQVVQAVVGLVFVALVAWCFVAGSSPEIRLVKEGHLASHPNIPVGAMIDQFVEGPIWSCGSAENGEQLVNVTGRVMFMSKPVNATLQFVVRGKSQSFEIHALEFNEIPQNQIIINAFIQEAARNYR